MTEVLPEQCMDMEFYVESYASFRIYKTFSFVVNGLFTTAVTLLGCVGNAALYRQVVQLPISQRLTTHLRILSFWDSLLLLCSFLSHGLMSLRHGIAPLYGGGAFLIYVFHPIGSVSVTGTLWQVVVITIERYLAVTRPFEARTRARLNVRWICVAIASLALAINLPTFLLEKKLQTCLLIGVNNSITEHAQIGFTDLHANYVYTLLCQFIPDLLFRCPVPFLLVAVCTVYTLQKCRNRTVGAVHITANRTVPVMLTLLNVKFLFCNSMYMFNTGLDLIGYSNPSKDTAPPPPNATVAPMTIEEIMAEQDASLTQFIMTLYLTDIANLMLVLHSSTNWLLFFRWPGSTKQATGQHKSAITSAQNAIVLAQVADKYGPENLGIDLLVALGMANKGLVKQCLVDDVTPQDAETMREAPQIRKQGKIIGNFIRSAIHDFEDQRTTLSHIRATLRRVGCIHQNLGINMLNEDWKVAKQFLTKSLTAARPDGSRPTEWWGYENPAAQFASFIIAEIKTGFLCEMVQVQGDKHKTQQRSPRRTRRSFNNNHLNEPSSISLPLSATSSVTTARTVVDIRLTNPVADAAEEDGAAEDDLLLTNGHHRFISGGNGAIHDRRTRTAVGLHESFDTEVTYVFETTI